MSINPKLLVSDEKMKMAQMDLLVEITAYQNILVSMQIQKDKDFTQEEVNKLLTNIEIGSLIISILNMVKRQISAVNNEGFLP